MTKTNDSFERWVIGVLLGLVAYLLIGLIIGWFYEKKTSEAYYKREGLYPHEVQRMAAVVVMMLGWIVIGPYELFKKHKTMRSLAILLLVGLSSCSIPSAPSASQTKDVVSSIRYTKDANTGLCYAIVQSQHETWEINSIACVPCDSLKRVYVDTTRDTSETKKK